MAKTDLPLVSVVVPTYDRLEYLHTALASVVAQSYPHLDIIVHDNASPSDPGPLVASFGDPRIRLYRNERNLGISVNATLGCRRAKGKYLAILGDDDRWQPEFIATLVGFLEADDEVVVAFCDHDVIDAAGRIDGALTDAVTRRYGRRQLRAGRHWPFHEIALLRRSICVMSGAVLRRDAIDWADVPDDIYMGFDIYVAYLAARTGKACYYCPQRLMQYRYHAQSASSTLVDMDVRIGNARDALVYWNRFLRDAGTGRIRRYVEMKRGFNALVVVVSLLRHGRARQAWGEFRRFLQEGLIRPQIFLYHAYYIWLLRRLTA